MYNEYNFQWKVDLKSKIILKKGKANDSEYYKTRDKKL
jgi:hypothetical protein